MWLLSNNTLIQTVECLWAVSLYSETMFQQMFSTFNIFSSTGVTTWKLLYLWVCVSACDCTSHRSQPLHIETCMHRPRVGPGHPSFTPCPFTSSSFALFHPLSIYFLIFCPFYFSLFFIGFTYFLLLSIPSFSTRIVPLRFQAGGRRKRLNLGLVCCV